MKVLLVSSGTIEDPQLLKKYSKEVDYILAVDGGSNYCIKNNIIPDMVIGDLDSIEEDILKIINEKNINILKYPVKKNATDSELAIDFLIEKDYKEIILLGSLGSRIDHSLANIYLLEYMLEKNVEGILINEKNIIYLVDNEKIIEKNKKYISIVPITDNGIEVSLEGFEYPLEKEKIKRGSTLGISNELKEKKGLVKIHKGKALVIISED